MNGRRVVITGAGRGLGLGLARVFTARGATVIGTVRARATAGELAATGAEVVELDVVTDDSIKAAAAAIAGPIDVLVNNAGIDARALGADHGDRGPLSLSREHFLGEIDVNAAGPMLTTRALLDQLEAADSPIVVNISSQLGAMTLGGPASDIGYHTSKAALNLITVRTAVELAGRGITVVAVHPGWVQTDMGGGGAALTIEESTEAIVTTIEGLTIADSGRFLRWDGTDHPW